MQPYILTQTYETTPLTQKYKSTLLTKKYKVVVQLFEREYTRAQCINLWALSCSMHARILHLKSLLIGGVLEALQRMNYNLVTKY